MIHIEWLTDEHDCDTCGFTCAEGARVWFKGEMIIEFVPRARCFDGDSWDRASIYREIISKTGHTISEEGGW